MFMAAAPALRAALDKGHVRSLAAVKVGGEVWVRGRMSSGELSTTLGTPSLRVIMPGTRLAELIMREANEEDHRSYPGSAITRAHRYCWIPESGHLAQRVVSLYFYCRAVKKVLGLQETGGSRTSR